MSYSIWLYKELDGEQYEVFEVGNYTSNVSPMWTKALGQNLGDLIDAIPDARILGPLIGMGIATMRGSADELRAMNPANGWGDYDGALAYLEKLLLGCRLHPDAKVEVHR